MQITPHIHIVGSGGIGISHPKDCHVYLLVANNWGILIDTGVGLQTNLIINQISQCGIKPDRIKYIFLTHVHADHAGGVASLRDWAKCPVVVHEIESQVLSSGDEELLGLKAAKRAGRYPLDYCFQPSEADIAITDDWTINFEGIEIKAIETPGHTHGSISFLASFPDENITLFSGDSVFWGGYISLLNIPGSSLENYRSTAEKLSNLNINGLFPGHGLWDISYGKRHLDQLYNRFLNSDLPPNIQN